MRKLIFLLLVTSIVACKTTSKIETKSSVKLDSTNVVKTQLSKDSAVVAIEKQLSVVKADLTNLRLSIADITSNITALENVKVTEIEYASNGNIAKSKTYESSKGTTTATSSKTTTSEYSKALISKYDSLIRVQATHVQLLYNKVNETEKRLKSNSVEIQRYRKAVAWIALCVFFILAASIVWLFVRPIKKHVPSLNIKRPK